MGSGQMDEGEVDATFADIVSRLGDEPSVPAQRTEVPWRVDPTGSVADALMSHDDELLDSADEHFVPPPPRELPPATDKSFWVALVGLVGGIALLLLTLLLQDSAPSWAGWLGALGVLVGFAAMVLRQPSRRDHPGNGAQV
ncbi:hypothetical protein [Marihabitans asiaticum]|nr:hypothetical protein [Marihabitans asiaticum]